ncbi:hypothetical protein [Streptacidiphilus sp. PAMC 29251]
MTTPAKPTWPLGKRPYLACRRSSEYDHQEPAPPAGTLVRLPGNVAVLYVGQKWTQTWAQTDALAEELRGAHFVELVGDMWEAARPAKRAINDSWTAANKAARDTAAPPKPPRSQAALCGRPGKRDVPCRQTAGWGTDTPGTGPCYWHGGSTVELDKTEQRVIEQIRVVRELARRAAAKAPFAEAQLAAALDLQNILLGMAAKRRRSPRSRRANQTPSASTRD